MKKIIVFIAEGFEEIEALTVVDILRRAGVTVTLCSLKNDLVKGAHNVLIKTDIMIDNLVFEDYDAIYLPGGLPGAYNLRDDNRVIEIIKNFNEKKKLIYAICAAPVVLSKAGITEDKVITSYPGFEKEIKCKNYSEEIFVKDGNITTSRGPATAMPFAYEILRQLGLEKESKELRKGMLFDK